MFSRRAKHESTGLTKTQQLRQAKSAARLRDLEQKDEASRMPETSTKRRVKPRYEPKKVDFSKPGMTKSMMARVKHAERVKEEYERKREETIMPNRMPKRTPAPIAGDARLGREKSFRRRSSISPVGSPPRGPSPSRMRESSFLDRSQASRKSDHLSTITEKATELARSMHADVVEAEPIGEGVIDSVVIPPGVVNENRTTVVSIPQPSGAGSDFLNTSNTSQLANRSIQVISDTLDVQDAAEATAVQQRLADLQQARRDFVIAVATVGGNSVNIPETPPRRLYRIPDLEDEMFQVEYGLDHPDVVAAREFAAKSMAGMKEREAGRRMEQEFERIARETVTDDLHIDVPFEEEFYQDPDISWEEDDAGFAFPRPSRVKAMMPRLPARQESYRYDPFDSEELERFFDVQRYPPGAMESSIGPPPGREQLHPDLWELEDPWYRPPPEPDVPDLIDFSRED